ncbi:Metal resistance protein YCF1 [Vanrija pseudolonga]|uniref:Metal resistance protein YCF1 n=1 Tax=Vanrija pseudolonga TaxID=143232 RepID=A0AAF0YK70_9TREE|nr:Metal resistance protein YCF1 [Vanrija pseudolonga]
MSAAQWFATTALAHSGGKKHTPGTIKCSWPIQVVSRRREFDLTECFELAILQPVPLVLSILVGLAQILYRTRKLKQTGPDSLDWITRSARNEKVAKTKVALLGFSAILAAAAAGLAAPQLPSSPWAFIHYALLAVTYVVFAYVVWLNHHTSRTSSALVLLFFPLYALISAVTVRTAILTGRLNPDLGHTLPGRLTLAREGLWFSSLGIGFIAFGFELYCPETQWKAWHAPWSSGKIRLEDDEENDTVAEPKLDDEIESPVATANIYERLTFSWLTPLLSLGTKKYLGEEDMWMLPPADSAEALSERLAKAWREQIDLVKQGKKKRPSLKIAIAKAYGLPYFVAGLMKALYDTLSFSQPQLLRWLLLFVQSYHTSGQEPMPAAAGFGIAILMFVTANVATALLHQYFDRCFSTTMRIKTGLITLIYRKSLRLSSGEKSGRTSGDIVNLQSVDAVRIGDIAQYGHIAWSGPFQIIIAFVSLYQLVGWQSFVGVAVMLISLPINTYISRLQKRLQRKLMAAKDVRTRLMSEILNNIKSIKLYGWEKAFVDKVLDARHNKELKMLRKIGIVTACSNFLWTTVPFLVAFATFSSFVFTADRPLTSEIIFPAISLFTLLSFPLAVFSNIINSIIEALVSVQRLEDFLAADELDPDARTVVYPQDDPNGEAQVGDSVVTIKDGEFRWARDSVEPILQDINLDVKKGELLAVIGRVGDGKSSLLGAMLGEMHRDEGSVNIRGDVAYFSQTSWILSATVKDNIIFGHRFDPIFYDKVLDACALRADLAVLPEGHMTEVGEKGVSLSGGQKARICLARACYARADIYLLDDPLSAVDAHVGRHIFDHVLGPNGILKNKARILCTNAVNVLPQATNIVMLRRGIIIERNTYDGAMADTSSELFKLITGLGKQSAKKNGEESGSVTPTVVGSATPSEDEADSVDEPDELRKRRADRRSSTATRRASILSLRQAKRDALHDLRESAKPKEHIEKGSVKFSIYKQYLTAAGLGGVAIFIIGLALGQGSSIFSNVILKYWGTLNQQMGRNVEVAKYLTAYGIMGFSSGLLNVLAMVTLRLYCGLRAASFMHDKAFISLMRSPLSFFELTPTGRILNLFSRDIFVIDEVLPMALGQFCRTFIQVAGVIVVLAWGAPIVLFALIPLTFIYRIIMRYYLSTSRELKRLDAVSRSPIFTFFGETLAGLPVIRAYNQTRRFQANNETRVDRNQACYQPAMAINRWLAVRLEFLGSCLMFSTALASVTALVLYGNIDAGLVGILMSYTISVTGSLNWFVRTASEVEQNIVSVERVSAYAELPSEAPEYIAATQPPSTWPPTGSIDFDDYSMRYRPELPLVLKDVTVNIKGGHRVGVVGRTGAGKSSLTLALFRILEGSGGKIVIDGVDISTIGLHALRSVISIIPQDPQLFEGTLRNNIDPTGKASDADMWAALEHSHLKDHVMRNMGGTLDAEVAEGGSNLSSGQRQLLCFARALLRKTKILVLDEATSSIDLETDAAVQQILRGPDFNGVTTLTIAHRINTIMDSDRVLVMSQGEVAEFDSPENLLKNRDSIFTSLVVEAGLGNNLVE